MVLKDVDYNQKKILTCSSVMNASFYIVSWIVSFLGGGVVVAIINWIRLERSENKQRRINFLSDQLRNLYGPLYYFVSQNMKCFDIYDRYLVAYREEFINEQWGHDENTRENLRRRSVKTLDIANKYIREVQKNNSKIKDILDSHYAFIDPEDIDDIMLFIEHHLRLNIEIEEEGILATPDGIYERIGDISYLRPEVIRRIESKFRQKKEELNCLLKK